MKMRKKVSKVSVCEKCGKETKELLLEGKWKCINCVSPSKRAAFKDNKNTLTVPNKIRGNIAGMWGDK